MTWDNGIISHTIKKEACVKALNAGSKSLKSDYKYRDVHLRRGKLQSYKGYTVICMLVIVNTRQAMYIERNSEAHSCTHCCTGKSIGITYSESVFTALAIQQVKFMHRIVICGLPASTIFLNMAQFSKINK